MRRRAAPVRPRECGCGLPCGCEAVFDALLEEWQGAPRF